MFDKILIASDGSKTADKAIDMGIDLARKYDCDVSALYIIDPAKTTFVLGDDEGGEVLDKITAKGKENGVTVIEHIITADPIKDFKVMICKINPDLVVIGAHGNSFDKQKYNSEKLGSVASKVLEVSKVPVLLVK